MKILMTNNALAERGGSESYLETVSSELRRLAHDVVLYSPRCGATADRLRRDGFTVVEDVEELPSDLDVIHGQHANAVARVRERFPTVPLVFASHSWFVSVEDPVAELGAGAFVAFNDPARRRLAAHAATQGKDVVRLTQPVPVSFADAARDRIGVVPRRAVLVSRRMTLQPARLAKACAALGLEFDWIGQEGRESADPRSEMRACDIVLASGRSALEGMAAGRAVVVVEEGGVSGWVSEASYAALEADGFTGLGGEPQEDLELLLGQYTQDLGTQARSLVVRHHAAQHHAAALVEIYTAVADTPPTAVAPESLGLLVQDRWALEARAVAAEWEVARLRTELADVGSELDGRLREREHLLARLEGLGARLRRTRARAQRFRRQRDKARQTRR